MAGVDVSVSKRFKFSAAHHLPDDPGPCQRMHGHTFDVEVFARGELRDGMVVHFDRLKQAWERVEPKLDHQDLNVSLPIEAQPPTTENVAAWLVNVLHGFVPEVYAVTISEGPTSTARAELA